MNVPTFEDDASTDTLAGEPESSADAITNHAQAVLGLADHLVRLSRECNEDELTKTSEAIVLELAAIVSLQGYELEEILPTEVCVDCGRSTLDFKRSQITGKATCHTCLVLEADRTLEGQLRASLDAAKAIREGGAAKPKPTCHSRSTILDGARRATADREGTYGSPEEAFERIAAMWSAVLLVTVTPAEVALCLAAMKIARAVHDPRQGDNWIDLAGYAAVGAEVAQARRSA